MTGFLYSSVKQVKSNKKGLSLPYGPVILGEEEKLQWLRLMLCDTVGPVTFFHLIRRFGGAAEALQRLPEMTRHAGRLEPLAMPSLSDALQEKERLEALGGMLVGWCEPLYPALLRLIPDAPPVLYVLGRKDLLSRLGPAQAVGIVGARHASALGMQMAHHLAQGLGQKGQVVVSGLARGIDKSAHEGSLMTGTVAVVAGGVDVVYPPEHQGLYDRVVHEGLIISETPLSRPVQAASFPRRNRIIAGLCWGVVVVEASLRSGSLVTSRLALEYNRVVMAVPGHPMDPRSHGTNHLIREGAGLVQNINDILEQQPTPMQQQSWEALQESEEPYAASSMESSYVNAQDVEELPQEMSDTILGFLGMLPVSVDELARHVPYPIGVIRAKLVELSLIGKIVHHPGDRVALPCSSQEIF